MSAIPDFVAERIAKWDAIMEKRKEAPVPEPSPIKVTLKNGNVLEVTNATTPFDIAKQLSNSLAKSAVVSKVDGKYWDMSRPLEFDCTLEIFPFDTPEGQHCFWHSSAHILGEALELEFKDAKLCIGPPLEDGGFYYDVALPKGVTISPDDYEKIQKRVNQIIKEKQDFTRIVLSKQEALDLFADNKFKQEIIGRIPDEEKTTAYRCGPLIDLCRGPHLPNTSKVTAMMITRNSSAYWNADATKDVLQRVYGISFPSKAQLDEHKLLLKHAEERDHRRLGTAQQLFFFSPLSPGSAFFLPHGARLYNKLQNYIRDQYRKRGYEEVLTPNVYNVDLWKQSGHYQNYKENMFTFEVEGAEFAMKPMNCPGHCVMFAHRLKSYRELPLRYADFGVLHRNELSGALTGLTRVRRFQQDDAHIFCRRDQIESEVSGVLDMLNEVYGHFGFTFNLCLSTRPEKYLGEVALWDEAEAALQRCLEDFCTKHQHTWSINPGDGAFYGPKIDIQLTDALKRKHQCGTCQLDFQLPIRFGLSYRSSERVEHEKSSEDNTDVVEPKKKFDKNDKEAKAARAAAYRAAYEKRKAEEAAGIKSEESKPEASVEQPPKEDQQQQQQLSVSGGCCAHDHEVVEATTEYQWKEIPLPPGHERPVMVHRAILGSVERMIAVLIEHTGGVWPFWLNPRQVCVVPIAETFFEYAQKVRQAVHDAGFYADVSDSNKQFNKKVAEALSEGYNFILVVGAKEQENTSVNVRFRDSKKQVEYSLEDVIKMFKDTEAQHL